MDRGGQDTGPSPYEYLLAELGACTAKGALQDRADIADVMVPTPNSIALFEALPNAKLSIFPDASHGGIRLRGIAPVTAWAIAFLLANSIKSNSRVKLLPAEAR